jgi:hypothetical protein
MHGVEVRIVEEPADKPVRSFHGEHVSEFAGVIDGHGKCWIDGVGFMRDGRRLRDGSEKVDKFLRKEAPASRG